MGVVFYNGVSSKDLGLVVQTLPTYDFPQKDLEFRHIPGLNGDVVLNNKNYQNTSRTYYFAKVFRKGESFVASSNKITEWLHSANDYVVLEDSYEPEYFRMALFKDNGSLPNYYDTATVIEATFICKPQRWLKIGDKPVAISSVNIELTNPTNYDAKPIIEFNAPANTTITITINNQTMTLSPLLNGDHIIIDCENMECYSATQSYNYYLSLSSDEFPSLTKKAISTVKIEGSGVTNATIKPRWWTL